MEYTLPMNRYFKRDLSWLSFNNRVLEEAQDETLSIGERIHFLAIFTSNLEEFYRVRVAEHKAVIEGKREEEEELTAQSELIELLKNIQIEVARQLNSRQEILKNHILPTLLKNHIHFYQSISEVPQKHKEFITNFFKQEVFPYLQPVTANKLWIHSFLRTDRLYLAVRVYQPKDTEKIKPHYYVIKLPYDKVKRFIELPQDNKVHSIMYLEDLIRANLNIIFPHYIIDSSYSINTTRDADIMINATDSKQVVEQLKKGVSKRKIGDVSRFVYDADMPQDFLNHLMMTYDIKERDLVPNETHLYLEDLSKLPLPENLCKNMVSHKPLFLIKKGEKIIDEITKRDLLLEYPYHSFDHFIQFLHEASEDPATKSIMMTQYRVALHSLVISELIAAAEHGKRVTVFVELKARFDEENNMTTAELMERAGIYIVYSMPKLKVHAKTALVLRRGPSKPSIAYISTGNFNEKTARTYADTALFTAHSGIVTDLKHLFALLGSRKLEKADKSQLPGNSIENQKDGKIVMKNVHFEHLLIAPFNLKATLHKLIEKEIEAAQNGEKAHIILKMNALQDKAMIDKLYKASLAGVKIELIIRGICCLIPGQEYSQNIEITRLVGRYLEHSRIWYFYQGGSEQMYLGSADWMKRNLYKRIEAITPIYDQKLKKELFNMLQYQLVDTDKGRLIGPDLKNIRKNNGHKKGKDAQNAFYDYLKDKMK
ncbi:MAG: polyphosphate kinase 1 [Bacteroidaceae bacterium]